MSCCNYTGYCCSYGRNGSSCSPCSNCIMPVLPSAPTSNYANAITTIGQTVLAGAAINFDTNVSIGGTAITHIGGTANFNLTKEGTYMISVTTVASAVSGNAASIGIAQNGAILEGTTVSENVTTVGNLVNLSTQSVVTLAAGSTANISVVNTQSVNTVYNNVNIIIVKIA